MARPSKPVSVIVAEGKAHRTKAELALRDGAEKQLLSGASLFERPEVKKNKLAHAEFKRVAALMRTIGKDDALYSSGINTYCMLYSEISDMRKRQSVIADTAAELGKKFEASGESDYENIKEFANLITKLYGQITALGTAIDGKRKMMLAIDKENVMTISSALRSIPKTPEKAENPLLKVLMEEDGCGN